MPPPSRLDETVEVLESWDDEETPNDGNTPEPNLTDSQEKTTTRKHRHKPKKDSDASESPSSDETTSESSDEDGNPDGDDFGQYRSDVISSYGNTMSRRVDLVGDYAGSELFLVDGESMLLHCFSDKTLDFKTGFQLLHAIYNVERFLQHLTRRKCNFRVVFFHKNQSSCVPLGSKPGKSYKYILARTILIRHLKVNIPASSSTVAIDEFSSYTSDEFSDYLKLHSPYFMMAHDGAESGRRKHRGEAKVTKRLRHAALREKIMYLLDRRLNVALLNGLEWRDTKIMATVLEHTKRPDAVSAQGILSPSSLSEHTISAPIDIDVESTRNITQHFTEKEALAVIVVSHILNGESEYGFRTDEADHLALSFLKHQVMSTNTPLSARRVQKERPTSSSDRFLRIAASLADAALQNKAWCQIASEHASRCDLADFVDGRLFFQTCDSAAALTGKADEKLDELLVAVKKLSGHAIQAHNIKSGQAKKKKSKAHKSVDTPKTRDLAVMPFSNPVFDEHLASIHLHIDQKAVQKRTPRSDRIFQEVTHWHNIKRPIIKKNAPTLSGKDQMRADRRIKRAMADMLKYAASLTDSVGKSLEPETIVKGSSVSIARTPSPALSLSDSSSSASTKPTKGKGGKQLNARKQAMLNQTAADQEKKMQSARDNIVRSWHNKCKELESEADPVNRFFKTRKYLATSDKIVKAECRLYMIHCLLQYLSRCPSEEREKLHNIAALIWSIVQDILSSADITEEVMQKVLLTATQLNLPLLHDGSSESLRSRSLPFTFALPGTVKIPSIAFEGADFQLSFCGPYLDRHFDSSPDNRVSFNPDKWQRRVLDDIDENKSVFAVAPTSAGKTFISFYAMRKVLESDDDGILVYVAPTKALVNQIAAEIQARYSKTFKYGGKSVWAIHTRDHRVNDATGCQVLVTVPHVLQIMLLAPNNATSWSTKVKRIIFDEIHSIGQAEDGVVWEQLLLLAPCPIIALSATVGNPKEFSDWLASTQKTNDLDVVQHLHRYSDLRKYYFVPPEKFVFQGLSERTAFGTLGLESATEFKHVHPVATLVDKSRGMPEDFALEPRDCLTLYHALLKYQTPKFTVADSLKPGNYLPKIPTKADVVRWEGALKSTLTEWMIHAESPFDDVVKDLEHSFRKEDRQPLQCSRSQPHVETESKNLSQDDYSGSTLAMLSSLHEQDALPAILFNFDRQDCEDVCQVLVAELENAELIQQKSGPKWDRKLEKWEEWKKMQEKMSSKQSRAKDSKKGKKGEDVDDERSSKLDKQREDAETSSSSWESFDPEVPLAGYHFTDPKKLPISELEEYERQLKYRDIPNWLIGALRRGIGVHHAGMNKKYRQIVEILFRKGFLRVVIATGTLALGINMPCKTVIFSGDSVFLTALNYRQCAGRAGRRGFDLLGNVVFQGVSREKVCRLISSRLPDLIGHFPTTTTLILRLFTLLHDSKKSAYAVSAINSMLSQPRLYMGGPSFKDQAMHHLRFSIEYLRRQSLLSPNGAPLNFAGLVSHLYFTENSAFAFHALLKEGYFHQLCAGMRHNKKDTLETLMLVMSHLFGRVYCRLSDLEYRKEIIKSSSSVVFLPPMPQTAAKILNEHNQETLDVYTTYVETFANQHLHAADRRLPLTLMEFGPEESQGVETIKSLPSVRVRSAFVALSGHGDDFESISDLCTTVRDGVFLEESVVPHVGLHMDRPLNAWALDFFKHGSVDTIEKANGIRRSDIWFMLNDFSLVLATIVTSLAGFLKQKEVSDMDMLDVVGEVDAVEDHGDVEAAQLEGQNETVATNPPRTFTPIPERAKTEPKKTKAANIDSWETLADEEEADDAARSREEAQAIAANNEKNGLWDGEKGGKGLEQVLKAFKELQVEFNLKFKAMWA